MYITPNPRFRESLIFLKCAREVLEHIVAESDVPNKLELRYFLVNEASDYEIMSLLLNGELPSKKFDTVQEMLLFSNLKEQMLSTPGLPEFLGEDIFSEVMTEVNSILPYQSSAVLMEHLAYVNEDIEGLKDLKAAKAAAKKWSRSGKKLTDVTPGAAKKAAKGASGKLAQKSGALPTAGKWSRAGGKLTDVTPSAAKKAAMPASGKLALKQGSGALPTAGKWGRGSYSTIGSKKATAWSRTGGKLTDVTPGAAKKAAMPASGKLALKQGSMPAGQWTRDAVPVKDIKSLKMAAQHPSTFAKKVGGGSGSELVAKMSKFATSPAGISVGGAALAALALYGGHKLYKNYMSKAARTCSGTGAAKQQCINQYKSRALDAEIKDLNAAKAACKASKDPAKCASAIQGKISKLQTRKAKLAR